MLLIDESEQAGKAESLNRARRSGNYEHRFKAPSDGTLLELIGLDRWPAGTVVGSREESRRAQRSRPTLSRAYGEHGRWAQAS
jgi:hypothetical protein